jgi:hypothetical protein
MELVAVSKRLLDLWLSTECKESYSRTDDGADAHAAGR